MSDDMSTSLLQLIQAGKGEALRIRAILRSLVPLDDLVGIISLPLQIPTLGKGADGAVGRGSGGGGDSAGERCWGGSGGAPRAALTPLFLPTDGALVQPKMSASFVPDHKASMVLFLDRVYGIENQDFLLHVLDVGFLPDMRAAASLDTVSSLVNLLAVGWVMGTVAALLLVLNLCTCHDPPPHQDRKQKPRKTLTSGKGWVEVSNTSGCNK